MTVAKTSIASPTSKATEKGWSITMTADTDEQIFEVSKYKEFALQVENLTPPDEIQVFFSNEATPTNWHQWKDATAQNPWTADDLAGDQIRYKNMRILRSGAASGTITSTLWLK